MSRAISSGSARATTRISKPSSRGGWMGRLLAPAFSRVGIEPSARRHLESAYAEGEVIHVLRSRRVLDPIFICNVLDRLDLPLPQWMHDHHLGRGESTGIEMLAALDRYEPVLLFLRQPSTITSPSTAYSENFVASLVARQRQTETPILLVPESLHWQARAQGVRRNILDVIFGDRDAPGEIRELLGFLLRYRQARYHVAEPVNVQAVLEREGHLPDEVIAKKIRWSILHHLARAEAVRTGPLERSGPRTRQAVLKDPSVQHVITSAPDDAQRAEMLTKGEAILKKMAADIRLTWVQVLDLIMDRVWTKIYDGIVVDEAGLERVRDTARRTPIVLVPSHKSHVDYLVLSQVFFRHGLAPPHIAAGENLSFWPLGAVFRRGGAFFIRRSFKGDKLYTAICAAYVKRLLKEGHTIEFFIEGGRSRTGKILSPRLGILGMCTEPVLEGALNDVHFVPVSISYEKVIESSSYTKELAGGSKKKEDVGALLSSSKVLRSRTRYGRVYIDFDEPLSLRAFLAARGIVLQPKDEIDASDLAPQRRPIVDQLGHRIVYGINDATRVTPTGIAALTLLSSTARRTEEEELYREAQRLIGVLQRIDARLSRSLEPETQREAIREAMGRLAQDGTLLMLPGPRNETIYEVPAHGRRTLDYYKNNTLHLFVPLAIIATGALAASREARRFNERDLRDDARRISQLLKLEFSFRAGDAGFETSFQETLEYLRAHGVLQRFDPMPEEDDVQWSVTTRGRDTARRLTGMIAVFFEAYRHVLELLADLSGPITDRDFTNLALKEGQRRIERGWVRRPEAISKLTIENGVRLFIGLGVLQRLESGKIGHGPGGKTALRALSDELTRYLGEKVRSRRPEPVSVVGT